VTRAAIELTRDSLRAVRTSGLSGKVTGHSEVPWNPAAPAEAITTLRDALGEMDSLSIVIGLDLLHVAHVDLPPAPHAAREQMIALEPERFFASEDPLVVALLPESPLAFAVSRDSIESWLAAFSAWAVVEAVEAGPRALARALGTASGSFCFEVSSSMAGVVTLEHGRLIMVRSGTAERLAEIGAAVPVSGAVDSRFLAAWGAIQNNDDSQTGMLWPMERRLAARRRALRSTLTAALAAVASFVLIATGADSWRERTLQTLTAEAERLTSEAAPALQALDQLAELDREVRLIDDVLARRPDPAAALAAISRALSEDAVVLTARGSADEWQIDGTARNAGALVPLLDQSGAFQNVRSLGASSRFLDGRRSRETFSIAFRVPTSSR
jgi:hypothetical protein